MADQRSSEPEYEAGAATKRPWAEPTLEVTPITDAEGPTSGFPVTDSVTGVS